jgi:hypothetical protein
LALRTEKSRHGFLLQLPVSYPEGLLLRCVSQSAIVGKTTDVHTMNNLNEIEISLAKILIMSIKNRYFSLQNLIMGDNGGGEKYKLVLTFSNHTAPITCYDGNQERETMVVDDHISLNLLQKSSSKIFPCYATDKKPFTISD